MASTFKPLSFNNVMAELETKIEKDLKETFKQVVEEMAPRIPVDYGLARSTLKEVGRDVGARVDISPRRASPTARHKQDSRDVIKSPSSGKFFVTIVRLKLSFEMRIDLNYLIFNDSGSRIPSAPWRAFASGYEKMVRVSKELIYQGVPKWLKKS